MLFRLWISLNLSFNTGFATFPFTIRPSSLKHYNSRLHRSDLMTSSCTSFLSEVNLATTYRDLSSRSNGGKFVLRIEDTDLERFSIISASCDCIVIRTSANVFWPLGLQGRIWITRAARTQSSVWKRRVFLYSLIFLFSAVLPLPSKATFVALAKVKL
ncbi:hypothetical protein Pyn_39273 [Prunus yedoensis var. nudiflora]|uniref:Uncharacterized protein n=1 Tax=Prunus yedoensis var. nudiflora TaxID=2094558 RepID=A0A314YDY1_PRUYE|nr:hypothetical protein Pyn_39273 [Prunus yedoensis var. nudiflora]